MLARAISLLSLVRHEWRRDVNNSNQPLLMERTLPPQYGTVACTCIVHVYLILRFHFDVSCPGNVDVTSSIFMDTQFFGLLEERERDNINQQGIL